MPKHLNIFFVGDINGKPGLTLVSTLLKQFIQKFEIDFCVVNGENTTEGKSISEEDAKTLFGLGVHVITSGNHLWDRWQIKKLLEKERNLLRPLNYPRENPGHGLIVYDLKEKGKVGVINVQGRTYMQPIDDPFKAADWAVSKIANDTKVILVDMHADATAEKMALGWHLDGRVSAVVGTHTHIPTADARILPGGTAYITDVGMSGPYDSVIGMKKEIAIRRFIHQTPYKFEIAEHDVRMCAVYIQVDAETGKATKIEQVIFPSF
ncbi:MAG: TIGR00282 family metallophosphoesterase [Ignavibacteriales bacterium]|nr:TIGR00282 family metallophosphoesterase [Ignavibacteriales bacterium]